MNTEKAIDLLDNLIGMIEDNQENDYDTAFHMAIDALKAQAERTEERTETHACDLIDRQAAIDALVGVTMFKTKHEIMQRVNASVQDEQGWLGAVAECLDEIEDLPSAQPVAKDINVPINVNDCISRQAAIQPTLYGYPVEHLVLIARVLQKENFPPERIAEMLSDVGRIVEMVRDEFEETLRKAVEQCMMT